MFSSDWLSSLKNQLRVRSSRKHLRSRRHQAPFSRALLSRNTAERLEDRTLLTVFTVVNTDDAGAGSLRDAIEQANASAGADTIAFDASLADQTIQLMNQLRITDDLTIIGLGSDQLTIDANHTGRIFDVYDGAHSANLYVSISGLTLANGDGTVLPDLENTTPTIRPDGGTSYKRYNTGGAIFNYEHLSVSDLVFQDNQARLGGAIFTQSSAGATTSIENSVFLRNAADEGGAVYSWSPVTVTGSSFVENQATSHGGAIYAYTLTVSGSHFTENSAQGSGGAIYHPYGALQVADSTFTGNVAAEDGGGIYHNYRKVWNWGAGITITDGPNAGMAVASLALGYPDPTQITNCDFFENSATHGGALYSVERIADVHPAADSFADPNQIVDTGSSYAFENSFDPQVILSDCYFKANTAELGGAILNRSGEMQIVDNTFADNTATQSGGALYNYGNLVMEDSTLIENSANSGGGVYNTGNFKLIDGYFLQNQATSTGGAVASSLGYLRIDDTYFGSNSAGQLGGGLYLVQGSRGYIIDEMGEILPSPSPLIENSIFNRNTAENGGGIYNAPWLDDISFQTLHVVNSTFYHNEATESGGGIFNGRTQLSVSGSEFSQNQAVDGAGINNLGGSVLIEESTLAENTASGSGGAIATIGHLFLYNSTLSGNHAALAGGGIYHRNGAEYDPTGNAVHDLTHDLQPNSHHVTSVATADTIPLWLLRSSLNVIHSTLVGNTAGTSGGGISTPEPGSRSTTTVQNSIVAGNAAAAGAQIAGEFTGQTNIIQDSIEDLIDPVLRDNGGPTQTHALLPGSSAINAGDNDVAENAGLINDQRGDGFERIVDGTVDIGAFEYSSSAVTSHLPDPVVALSVIELSVVKSPTVTNANGEVDALPESISWIDEWGNYWVEIWVMSQGHSDVQGIFSVDLDLSYNTSVTSATEIEYGAPFTENQSGTINDQTGLITGLSAETSSHEVGIGQRVLFARIKFESRDDDHVDLDLEAGTLNPQSLGLQLLQPSVLLTDHSQSLTIFSTGSPIQVYANPYDLNDDGEVDFDDLRQFVSVYKATPSEADSPYAQLGDYNGDDVVDFQDLRLFARNYGKSQLNQKPGVYPENFVGRWNSQRQVESQSEPAANPSAVTQPTAESVLASVVEQRGSNWNPTQSVVLNQVDVKVNDLPGDLTLIAGPESEAAEEGELKTLSPHELGFLLGCDHQVEDVIQETLSTGVRRLPDWSEDETDSFFSGLSDGSELVLF